MQTGKFVRIRVMVKVRIRVVLMSCVVVLFCGSTCTVLPAQYFHKIKLQHVLLPVFYTFHIHILHYSSALYPSWELLQNCNSCYLHSRVSVESTTINTTCNSAAHAKHTRLWCWGSRGRVSHGGRVIGVISINTSGIKIISLFEPYKIGMQLNDSMCEHYR